MFWRSGFGGGVRRGLARPADGVAARVRGRGHALGVPPQPLGTLRQGRPREQGRNSVLLP